MNLTIPIMKDQMAQIIIHDKKKDEVFTWHCNHRESICIRHENGSKAQIIYKHSGNADLRVKGIGRNKRFCSTNLKLKCKGEDDGKEI